MKLRLALIILGSLTLVGCGVKDPSFYDLKSPCVSIKLDGFEQDPCARTSPLLNQLYDGQISTL